MSVFYDIETSLWSSWKNNDDSHLNNQEYLNNPENLLEGSYIYKEGNKYETISELDIEYFSQKGFGSDGIGYVSGFEKESETNFLKCGGIQFEILQTSEDNIDFFDTYFSDFDLDGISTLSEMFYFIHLDHHTLSPVKWDSDNDDVPDGWEIQYQFSPTDEKDMDKYIPFTLGHDNKPILSNDKDFDGITNYNEYSLNIDPEYFSVYRNIDEHLFIVEMHTSNNMYRYCSNPTRKDIFVEVDWMKDEGILPEEISLVQLGFFRTSKAIQRKGIYFTLHVDSGNMKQGGEIIPSAKETILKPKSPYNKDDIQNNDLYDYKWGNNWEPVDGPMPEGYSLRNYKPEDRILLDDNDIRFFTMERVNIFHYCLCVKNVKKVTGGDVAGVGQVGRGNFMISRDSKAGSSAKHFHLLLTASVFMHELGHNLNLNHPEETWISDKINDGFGYDDGYGAFDDKTTMNYLYDGVEFSDSEWIQLLYGGIQTITWNDK